MLSLFSFVPSFLGLWVYWLTIFLAVHMFLSTWPRLWSCQFRWGKYFGSCLMGHTNRFYGHITVHTLLSGTFVIVNLGESISWWCFKDTQGQWFDVMRADKPTHYLWVWTSKEFMNWNQIESSRPFHAIRNQTKVVFYISLCFSPLYKYCIKFLPRFWWYGVKIDPLLGH